MVMTRGESIAAGAVVAGLSAGAWLHAALYPTSQLFGRVVIAGADPNEIALTYDDGPNPEATPHMLEVLAQHDVRATFFLIGAFVRRQPALAREIAGAGHAIGDHTMTHPWLAWQSARRIREEIGGAKSAIEDTIGATVTLFRPPHGARRPLVFEIAREMGMATVNWNIITHDWRAQPSEAIVAKVHNGIRRNQVYGRGSNVLLHDGGMGQARMPSVAATKSIIHDAKAKGMRFVTPEIWV